VTGIEVAIKGLKYLKNARYYTRGLTLSASGYPLVYF
jgi:hypothetical protein